MPASLADEGKYARIASSSHSAWACTVRSGCGGSGGGACAAPVPVPLGVPALLACATTVPGARTTPLVATSPVPLGLSPVTATSFVSFENSSGTTMIGGARVGSGGGGGGGGSLRC